MSWHVARMLAALTPRVSTSVSFMRPDNLDSQFLDQCEAAAGRSRPFLLGGHLLQQSTAQTCGAMVLLTARILNSADLRRKVEANPNCIDELESKLYADLRSAAIGTLSWPESLGTPPWTLARELSGADVEYLSVPVDDTTEDGWQALQWAYHATCAGQMVPLYSGGSIGSLARSHRGNGIGEWILRSLLSAFPRHVLLAIPGRVVDDDGMPVMTIYDPSSGDIHEVPLIALMNRKNPGAALGRWTHIVWALLPRPNVK